jgi:predicted dehydrogenase
MKVGIIGCGAIASRAHIPSFARAGVQVVAVADTDISRANSFAHKFGIPRVYSDFRQLLDEDLNLVSVCTPPKTHALIATEAAQKGKHILLEKPMTTTLAEAEDLVSACTANKTKLCVVHQYRFIPCVQEARRRMADGRLGKIISIHLTAHPQFPMRWADSGWLYDRWGLLDDVGVHLLDILTFLSDANAIRVSVGTLDSTGKMGFFDSIHVTLELEDSLAVYLDLSWMIGSYELTASIFGTAGKAMLDIRNNFLSEIHGYVTPFDEMGQTFRKSTRAFASALTRKYFRGTLIYHDVLIQSFIDSILKGKPPPVGPLEGLRIVRLLEKIKLAN